MTSAPATGPARPLADRLARRGPDMPVVVTQGSSLSAAGLVRHGPATGTGPDTRLALCLSDPGSLITALVALDGQVAALLLISPAQPPEVVAALATVAGVGRIVTDRADLRACRGFAGWMPCWPRRGLRLILRLILRLRLSQPNG